METGAVKLKYHKSNQYDSCTLFTQNVALKSHVALLDVSDQV